VDLEYKIKKPTLVHGISSWFDTSFKGTSQEVVLSTSPYSNPTHWYQIRLLFPEPIAINKGQKLVGKIHFKANRLQSYHIYLKIGIQDIPITVENVYDLKDPDFRGFSGYTYSNTNTSSNKSK
jgi:histone-arginine methyltransferase CARM1